MKLIILLSVFCSFSVKSQTGIIGIDTISIACKRDLAIEYQSKFDGINKKALSATHAQKKIIREITSEIQEDFLEKISDNDFICDGTISPYLEGLMNEILTKNAIDKKGYRILLSRSPEINAYNTGDGTVVVNYGLFLAVDNEDELVFVIAHEIGHQHLEHVRKDIDAFAKLSTSEAISIRW